MKHVGFTVQCKRTGRHHDKWLTGFATTLNYKTPVWGRKRNAVVVSGDTSDKAYRHPDFDGAKFVPVELDV